MESLFPVRARACARARAGIIIGWRWWPSPCGDHVELLALDGPPVVLELWLGVGWTATRARWPLAGSGAPLAWS